MVKAAGVAAGALFITVGLSAMLGGADLFGHHGQVHSVSQAPRPAPPSPHPSPSAQTTPEDESVTAAGTIYTGWQGGGKKKHGKG